MSNRRIGEAFILGGLLCIGLAACGYFISEAVTRIKAAERTVTVKGLSEREVSANIAIWPIKFSVADKELASLFSKIQRNNSLIIRFLKTHGFKDPEISISAPAITDKQAQGYADPNKIKFRYSGSSTITVYTKNVELVRGTMKNLVELGKAGIAISGQDYNSKTEFLFTGLNKIKPEMIEEATKNAREVAQRFAKDSQSTLGKIRHARQGQFSIRDRDSNTPYIKKVRVVSTVEYYLSD